MPVGFATAALGGEIEIPTLDGETTKAKILPFLDEQAIDFLQTCPFGLMATAGRDGPIEVSPKGDEPGFVRASRSMSQIGG